MPSQIEFDLIIQQAEASVAKRQQVEDRPRLIEAMTKGEISAEQFLKDYVEEPNIKALLAAMSLPHVMSLLGDQLSEVYKKLITHERGDVNVLAAYQINDVLAVIKNDGDRAELLNEFIQSPVLDRVHGRYVKAADKIVFHRVPPFAEYLVNLVAEVYTPPSPLTARPVKPLSNKVTLRQAVAEDAEFVDQLVFDTMLPYVQDTWSDPVDLDAYWAKNKFNQLPTQIIEYDGKDVGAITVIENDRIFLDEIHTLPEYQGLGIGTGLINQILEKAQRIGKSAELTVLQTNPAQELYLRLGFEETLTNPSDPRRRYLQYLGDPRSPVRTFKPLGVLMSFQEFYEERVLVNDMFYYKLEKSFVAAMPPEEKESMAQSCRGIAADDYKKSLVALKEYYFLMWEIYEGKKDIREYRDRLNEIPESLTTRVCGYFDSKVTSQEIRRLGPELNQLETSREQLEVSRGKLIESQKQLEQFEQLRDKLIKRKRRAIMVATLSGAYLAARLLTYVAESVTDHMHHHKSTPPVPIRKPIANQNPMPQRQIHLHP